MKVLLINKFHYHKGGSETYYFGLAEALSAMGHEVIFFAMHDPKNMPCKQEAFFAENVDYNCKHGVIAQIRNGARLIYSIDNKRKMKALIEAEKPDIAHVNLAHRQLTLSIIDALYEHKVPIVFTLHDLVCVCPCYTMLSPNGICEKCLTGKYINCVKQKCVKGSRLKSLLAVLEAYFLKFHHSYNKIGLYITPSDFYRRRMEEGGFTTSAIVHIKNFLPLHTTFKKSEDNEGYLLFFGRLSQEKGVLTLLQAVKNLGAEIPLYIAGDGPQKEDVESFISKNGLDNQVKILGYQNRENMERIVEKCKCVILPSEWYENGPYSIMEAMAKGKPVIGSRIGGIPELIEDGITGYTFEPCNATALADAIHKMLTLPEEEYNAMCDAALNKAKQDFDWQQYVKKLVGLYEMQIQKASERMQSICPAEDYTAL